MNALSVGSYTGEFIANLINMTGLSHANLHLVGFSLGGQGVGAMGRKLEELTGIKADRLTAIEPAAPYFDILEPVGTWVGYNDAAFVDVIHSNSDSVFCDGLSMYGPLGNVDFYPNGGLHQPGCTDNLPLLQPIQWAVIPSCSHQKGLDYFIESLNSNFVGTLCDSWEKFTSGECNGNEQASIGIALNSSVATSGSVRYGKYYLNVNENSPYYNESGNAAVSGDRDGTPSITSMWGWAGANQACNIATLLKAATFGQYDLTQTEWYHDLVATAWYGTPFG